MTRVYVLMFHETCGKGVDCNGSVVSVHSTYEGALSKLHSIGDCFTEENVTEIDPFGNTQQTWYRFRPNPDVVVDSECQESFGPSTVMIVEKEIE